MTIKDIQSSIPDYAKDLRVNLGNVLGGRASPGLEPRQIHAIALAVALAARHPGFAEAIGRVAGRELDDAHLEAARAAAAIMAMNNVYYRFVHLVGDEAYGQMPAGLRMQVLARPGIDKETFELMSLAVSALNGCGLCITSHERVLREAGVTREAVQSAVRIAAVVGAVATVLDHAAEGLSRAA